MNRNLQNFCRRCRVVYDGEPRMLASPSRAWIIHDVEGKKWVAKEQTPRDQTVQLLKNFALLHPCFHYPQPVSEDSEEFYLYPYLEGERLADRPFEDAATIERVTELTARLQALFRSLVLVPFYQETLKSKVSMMYVAGGLNRFALERVQRMDDQQKSTRHKEMAQSYQWAEKRLETCVRQLGTRPLWSGAALEAFRNKMRSKFCIHMPITGNNLSHAALTPEHLVLCPDHNFAIVGWHIQPRPRFYMFYTYLAWSFTHSRREDAKPFYRGYLAENSSKAFFQEHHLVFAFCLLEQTVSMLEKRTMSQYGRCRGPEHNAAELFNECLEKLSG